MTAKDYLRSIRDSDRRINAKLDQATRLRSLAERMTSVLDPNRGSGRSSGDKTDSIDRLIDLERELDTMVNELVDKKRCAMAAIEALEDDRERDVLRFRYLNGWSWQRIAMALHCDRSTVWRWHGDALQHIRIP